MLFVSTVYDFHACTFDLETASLVRDDEDISLFFTSILDFSILFTLS